MTQEINLSELQEACKKMFIQKAKVAKMKELKTIEEKIFSDMENGIIDMLEHHNLKTFDTGFGKVTRTNKPYAKITDKDALGKFLKERGIFEDLITFNAAKMNSFYNEEMDRAKENMDLDFKVDGMEISSNRVKLSVRNIDLSNQ